MICNNSLLELCLVGTKAYVKIYTTPLGFRILLLKIIPIFKVPKIFLTDFIELANKKNNSSYIEQPLQLHSLFEMLSFDAVHFIEF